MKDIKVYSFPNSCIGFIEHVAYFVPDKTENDHEIYVLESDKQENYKVRNIGEQKGTEAIYVENPTMEQKAFALLNYLSLHNSRSAERKMSEDFFYDFILTMQDVWNSKTTVDETFKKLTSNLNMPKNKKGMCFNVIFDLTNDMNKSNEKEMIL